MKIKLGQDYFRANDGISTPIYWDTSKLINGHLFLIGSSGVGKSYTIRKLIRRALAAMGSKKVRFHVFDVHGDLAIKGASEVSFSESSPYGLNPLKVNPDPEFGGVRKCIQNFIKTIDTAGRSKIGVRQEAIITNLLIDVYKSFGFDHEDSRTWGFNAAQVRLAGDLGDNRIYLEVPIAEKEEAKALGARWDGTDKRMWWVHTEKYEGAITKWRPAFKARAYPSLKDVLAYAERIYQERFIGSDQKAVLALTNLNKKAQAFQRKLLDDVRRQNGYSTVKDPAFKESIKEAKEAAIAAFTDYANSIQTGLELENLMKYDSAEEIRSIINRLNNLIRTGIYNERTPPFDENCAVWRYKLKPLSLEEKKMFVTFTLQEIYSRALERGDQSDVVEVVVLDELGIYVTQGDKSDNGDGIIGTICREARKFGVAFWGATQSPATLPESLLTTTATKIILGLDEYFWLSAIAKLRIDSRLLEWIQAQVTMAVQMKEKGMLKNRWLWVKLEDDD